MVTHFGFQEFVTSLSSWPIPDRHVMVGGFINCYQETPTILRRQKVNSSEAIKVPSLQRNKYYKSGLFSTLNHKNRRQKYVSSGNHHLSNNKEKEKDKKQMKNNATEQILTYRFGEGQAGHRAFNVTDANDVKSVEAHAIPDTDVGLSMG